MLDYEVLHGSEQLAIYRARSIAEATYLWIEKLAFDHGVFGTQLIKDMLATITVRVMVDD